MKPANYQAFPFFTKNRFFSALVVYITFMLIPVYAALQQANIEFNQAAGSLALFFHRSLSRVFCVLHYPVRSFYQKNRTLLSSTAYWEFQFSTLYAILRRTKPIWRKSLWANCIIYCICSFLSIFYCHRGDANSGNFILASLILIKKLSRKSPSALRLRVIFYDSWAIT